MIYKDEYVRMQKLRLDSSEWFILRSIEVIWVRSSIISVTHFGHLVQIESFWDPFWVIWFISRDDFVAHILVV